jgi:hypothetical protein
MKFKGSEIAKLFTWLDDNTKAKENTLDKGDKKAKKSCGCGMFCCLKGFF